MKNILTFLLPMLLLSTSAEARLNLDDINGDYFIFGHCYFGNQQTPRLELGAFDTSRNKLILEVSIESYQDRYILDESGDKYNGLNDDSQFVYIFSDAITGVIKNIPFNCPNLNASNLNQNNG